MNAHTHRPLLPDALAASIRQCLLDSPRVTCSQPPGAALAAVAEALRRDPGVSAVLVVLPTSIALDKFCADMEAFCADVSAFHDYPMSGVSEDDPEAVRARLSVLTCLAAERGPCVVVATCVQAMLQSSPDPACVERMSFSLSRGDTPGLEKLVDWLIAAGYRREPEVFDVHTFAVKGGIVDVWPAASRQPVRIEFFGDDVESLRAFNVFDQRSTHQLEAVKISPMHMAFQTHVQLHTYVPDDAVVLWIDHEEVELEAAIFAENSVLPESQRLPSVLAALESKKHLRMIFIGDPPPPDAEPIVFPFGALDGLGAADAHYHDPDFLALQRRKFIAACKQHHLDSKALLYVCLDSPAMVAAMAGEFEDVPVDIRASSLSGGFSFLETDGRVRAIFLGQADLYGQTKRPRMRSAEPLMLPEETVDRVGTDALDAVSPTLDHIEPGDHVVHIEYGIGRFTGTKEMELSGRLSEVLCIEYGNNTRLFVPVSHANLISRYKGAGDAPVRLHVIGGRRWSGDKEQAQQAVENLALRMLETQARRKQMKGFAFATVTPYLDAFEASFPYAETAGQLACIEQVKRDMTSIHPMDRLVCGDAGYGKTEVAIRAAFICAMQERQVAILVPTTVLAQQHYDTFCDRLAAYPLNIAMHSRFCSQGQRDAALDGIANGTVDIIIGTHGILQPNIRFKNLGLVVIDEEQRFGVRHKEFLKTIRLMVDVLTLSATPIPRTLYLGLMGARDLSLLQTPPQERVATETRVVRKSDDVVKQAILSEINRGGQVFYVHNRVLTINRVHQHLSTLLPHIRIGVGHGQMPTAQIERVMRDFSAGLYDVLLCTTIIESGIDIPRANTILVDRADRFGIADLYQLRGRVGRAGIKAYAYFMLPPDSLIASDARERLTALQQHSGLGTGVSLSMRDLSIRGAGNLLGAEQSGHIAAIGFNLYCQLLRRAVARLRGEQPPLLIDVAVSVPFLTFAPSTSDSENSACLPYDYLDDDPQRLEFHRRLAESASEGDLAELEHDMVDRFGVLPSPAKRLFLFASIRVLAASHGIRRVEVDDDDQLLLERGGVASRRTDTVLLRLGEGTAEDRLTEIAGAIRRG